MHKFPWPIAPRPFADEAFGSWLGRVASRYRIGVDELVHAADVDVELGEGDWLALPAPGERSAERLAALCRMEPEDLARMLPSTRENGRRFPYCFGCLILNPQDVTAPYWKADWLAAKAPGCTVHPQRGSWVTVETLRRQRNLRQLVQYISCRQRTARHRTALPISGFRGPASVVRGPG